MSPRLIFFTNTKTCRRVWHAWQDSNLRPTVPETVALSPELQAQPFYYLCLRGDITQRHHLDCGQIVTKSQVDIVLLYPAKFKLHNRMIAPTLHLFLSNVKFNTILIRDATSKKNSLDHSASDSVFLTNGSTSPRAWSMLIWSILLEILFLKSLGVNFDFNPYYSTIIEGQ